MDEGLQHGSYLVEVLFLLLAAVAMVSVFRRLGLGAIMGYLVAGALIGPHGFALVKDLKSTQELAELGVVFLLFTVGLELPFHRIKLMRGPVFLLGAAQVGVTTLIFSLAGWAFGLTPAAATVVGGALAFSSTAIVLRMLSDQGGLNSQFGRTVFAVLLVQDLAVGPFLVVALALGQDSVSLPVALGLAALKTVIAIMAILGIGRIVLRHIFSQVALAQEREVFVGLTLFVVLAAGLMTQSAGLSLAFGAFLAGMLLAETQFRHQVAADIQPFRGLLLGLFFMTVGMSIDFSVTLENWLLMMGLVPGLLLAKAAILFVLARLFRQQQADALHLGLLLSQAGEFAFVLLGAGLVSGLLMSAEMQIITVAVALTMLVTPFLATAAEHLAGRVEKKSALKVEDAAATQPELAGHIVIAGFGRVGRAVANRLEEEGTKYIAVDMNPHRVTQAAKQNLPVYYGDATLPEILDVVHIESARAMVVALSSAKAATQTVAMVRYIFPDLKVYARAKNEEHAKELKEAGADIVVPELVATGVKLAGEAMMGRRSTDPPTSKTFID